LGQTIVTDVTSTSQLTADTFPSFGVLLKYLRRRARLTQAELAIAVGFSREQITKLENGQRTPDKITLQALFLPALDLASDDQLALRLLELAEIVQTPKEADTGPAPGTLGARGAPTNLPAPLTSFVGRVREVAEVTRLLSTTRLLALTGAGGAGKTRLALEVGAALLHTFRDGVWLVELAPVTDPLLVAPAVAAALEVPTASGRLPEQLVADHLHDKHLLLILDNCEHLLAACACLAEAWLRAAPQLQILATSRESLGC
jgi:transcriptional regulator with XRE-family HTH domain